MKKLLALVLVLGIASMANAALTLSVSYDGGQTYEPAVSSEIFLLPTETIWIGVSSDPQPGGWNGIVGIVSPGNVPNTLGEWGGNSQIYSPPALADASVTDPLFWGSMYYELEYWGMGNSEVSIDPSLEGVAFGFEFHCLGVDPLTGEGSVEIIVAGGPTVNPDERLIIHQIPEPMTMALLGLGGLALIRRRR